MAQASRGNVLEKEVPAVSLSEQWRIDYSTFMAHQVLAATTTVSHEQHMTTDKFVTGENAEKFIDDILPQLSSDYRWLKNVDNQQIARLLNEVLQYRDDYSREYGKLPSDGQIYRNHRLALERDTENDQELYDKVVLLAALMNGNITKGSLSSLDPYVH